MEDTTKRYCSILFDVLKDQGVKDVVCSPGSRNVPLLIAAACRKEFKKHFVVDERSAAFVGLGISLVSKKPVALICTSGTALLNYAPAVAEAYYQSIPLIIISADRPEQWIDQDDSQTLRQDHALDNYVKKSYSIPAFGEEMPEMQWYVNRIANDAVSEACNGRKGPVHINVHLSEPLGRKHECDPGRERIIQTLTADSFNNKEIYKELAAEIAHSNVLLVAGFMQPDSKLQNVVTDFCRLPNVAVMAETISNLHLKEGDTSVDSVLTAYSEEELERHAPDIVISIGGALVSRKLKEYLRRNAGKCSHWSVGYSHVTTDPFMALTKRIETQPSRFFRNIHLYLRKSEIKKDCADYKERWTNLRFKATEWKNKFVAESEWSELKAFEILLNRLPHDYNLFLSNGTSVRYAQIISYALPHASYCNRGVSGIDGSISTAIGGGSAYRGKSLIVTGDLSMAYDIGALSLKMVPENFKIVVIDNQGGGIFRFIPSTSGLEEREEYLCQQQILPMKQLAEGYGWCYFEASDEAQLKDEFSKFLSCENKAILKVNVDGELSAKILREYMNLKL